MVDRRRSRRLRARVRALEEGGAAALELGFPFSDPIADGPTLEAAADRSLAGGTRWADLVAAVSEASERLPTAVMTYANPVWSRGLGSALGEIRGAGATGLIVPDLSFEESAPWRSAARRAGLSLVLLAAPTASRPRMREIARASSGFLYLVSRFGITGRAPPTPSRTLGPLVREAHRAAPRLPVLVGFGIRDRSSARRALASGADGVVVGSALEERLGAGASDAALAHWLRALLPRSLPDEG
jgi:tryptophan synthase alpha chain